jgi:hypothetical protein
MCPITPWLLNSADARCSCIAGGTVGTGVGVAVGAGVGTSRLQNPQVNAHSVLMNELDAPSHSPLLFHVAHLEFASAQSSVAGILSVGDAVPAGVVAPPAEALVLAGQVPQLLGH